MMQQLGKIFSPRRRDSEVSQDASPTPKSRQLQELQAALTAAYTQEERKQSEGEAPANEAVASVEQVVPEEQQADPVDDDMSDVENADSIQPDAPPQSEAPANEAVASVEQVVPEEQQADPVDDDMSDVENADSIQPDAPPQSEAPANEAVASVEQVVPEEQQADPAHDDMSDVRQVGRTKQVAQGDAAGHFLPLRDDGEEALPCDDDLSDGAQVEGDVSHAGPTPGSLATPRRRSVATKVADCKARLAELQALKVQKLEDEDYMGAHEAKQKILEQEQMLQALRVEGTPTPGRAPAEGDTRWCPSEDRPDGMELQGLEGNPFTLPNDVFDRLYGYQREGVAWMAKLLSRQHGGVLADEMGLGKTIQVCALLNGARKAGKTHALLLMPVTLLDQWSREAKIWCPGWPVYTYYGTVTQRAKALRGIRRPMGGLLLTSYSLGINCEELLQVRVEDAPEPTRRRGRPPGSQPSKRRKLDDDDGEGEAVESEEEIEPELPGGGEGLPEIGSTRAWDLVICDEAHRMKNMSSLLAKSLRGLKSNCRILLTGTPVQNALQDLWALMDFAQPGLLGNHATFVKTFSEPIDRGSVRGAKVWAVELKKHLAEQLRNLINPHLLRRTKTSAGIMGDGETEGSGEDAEMEDSTPDVEGVVKKLPSKKETIVWLYPSEEQEAMYKKVLEQSEVIREACNKSKLGIEVFRAIGLLKRLCNHPLLLLQMPKVKDWADFLKEVQETGTTSTEAEKEVSEAEQDEAMAAVASVDAEAAEAGEDGADPPSPDVEEMLSKLSRNCQDVLRQSAKLRCLSKLLPDLAAKGHRTLVFSQSVKMLDLVQICCLKPNGLRCLRIDGLTETQARAEKVAKFNSQPERFQCMLLTTAVGGVGLNLTAADRVVLVDPAWNPATDAQAVDRAYRIGQTKEVRVYRLIMSGMVEDKMFRLQVFKMGLTRTALEADQQHRYFTAKEIRALFEWVDPSKGETRELLREKHGEDETVQLAAAEDAEGEKGWLSEPIGLSDFACLYGTSQEEEAQDEGFSAQVAEAKQQLEAADEKLQGKQKAKEDAEAALTQWSKDWDEVMIWLDAIKERRMRAEEGLKDKRSELTQAKREETAAQQRLDKANKNLTSVQDKLLQHQHSLTVASEALETAVKSATEAVQNATTAGESFSQALSEASKQLDLVDQRGSAAGDGAADAAPDRLRKASKALDKLKNVMDTNSIREGEFQTAEENLLKLEPGRERDRHRLEQSVSKAQQRAEASREAVLQAVQNFVEAGMWFAESLQKTQKRPVKMEQVKGIQSTMKGAFRQLPKAWQMVKGSKEVLSKAGLQRRKASSRLAAVTLAKVEAESQVEAQQKEHQHAEGDESHVRGERCARESELATAEELRQAVDAEEAEAKKRREELKATQVGLKDALKAAKSQEREADNERKALHARASKREKEREMLEEAKNTAVKHLKAEEYDARQVEQAYSEKRGAKKAD